MVDIQRIKQEMRDHVREKMDYGRDYCDEEVEELIDEELLESPDTCRLTVEQRLRLKKELFDSMRRLDVLQFFVEDPTVTEIMINGRDHIFVERNGRLTRLDLSFDSKERLSDVIQQIVAGCNRVVNEASPIVDARLPDGARVNVVMDPVAINGPIVTIRRFPQKPITMEQLMAFGSITKEAAEFLERLVKAHYNIFISGGTGSGKTTFLNALSAYAQRDERIITIEDSAELQLLGVDNLVRLETRNGNTSGCREITIRELIRTSLRMRPDRIIVGEVRGAEAMDMLQCLNTGHDGSMSTGHANSARDMLSRLENMVLMGMELPLAAIRQQIASGIDLIVHLGRLRDKSRKVLEIAEVLGYQDGEVQLATLFAFEEMGQEEDGRVLGKLVRKGELLHEDKLKTAGLSPV
ncbi:MAG: CpaF family protein [Lachnospiraceae bacterium]|jgi:pilus assembly protein CpaF|nr:CpaF family protein [Lachnospiraceae bacterium]